MSKYLLSTYAVDGQVQGAPASPEEMAEFMQRVATLEEEMDSRGAFVFGGALHGPDASTTLRPADPEVLMTDGPFVEAKEHIAGFYIINAADLDEALEWARKVVETINHPIEVRPFAASGRVEV
jgi:hypothetical protein